MTFRHIRPALLCVLFIACALGVSGAAPAPDPAPKPAPPEPSASRLFKPRTFEGFVDPKTTLREALAHLGEVYDVTIEVNEEAFKDEGLAEVLAAPVAEKPVPKMAGASLDRVLRKVLARLPVPSGAAYMVRADHVEVTTRRAQVNEVWGKYEGPYLPLVHADFEGRPLGEALQELAEQAAFSVVVDARAADKAKTPVSASFTNLPLDTAVRVLADMADLKPFLVDNLLYVTTRDNADRLDERERQRSAADSEVAPRVGNGPRRGPVLSPAGM